MELITLTMLFTAATQTVDLPKGLLSALCYVESHHNPKAVHKDDGNSSSLGICQIKHETAKLMGFKGSQAHLMDPKVNTIYAAKYLKKQLVRYNNDIPKAVAAYNSGTYKENKHKKPVNEQYVRKVFAAWALKK